MSLAQRVPRLAWVGAIVLVVVAAALVTNRVWGGGDTAPGQLPRSGTLSVVPVSESGGTPTTDGSQPVALVRFAQAREGRRVTLERKQDGSWSYLASGDIGADGSASIPLEQEAEQPGGLRAALLDEAGSRAAVTSVVDHRPWDLVFDDDFDGERLDDAKWTVRQPGLYNESGSRKCSKSDPRAVDIAGGTLRLGVMLDPERLEERCASPEGRFRYFLNGHIGTEETFDFRYGFAEARVRFPRERGQHGAFWLQRDGEIPQVPGDPGVSGAEIDVVEFFGEGYPKGGLAAFVHYLNAEGEGEKVGGLRPNASRALESGDAWWRSFHDFSVEWTPKRYIFRVDGREVLRTTKGVSGVEQFLVLSLLTSDWELPDLDEASLPSTMEIDHVRVWQQDASRG
jgi:beta-glucanase (GH16 family)